jgi:PAS domain S-box-containing protein
VANAASSFPFGFEEIPGIAAIVTDGGEVIAANEAFHKLPPLPPSEGSAALTQRTLLDAGLRCLKGGKEESFEAGEAGESGPVSWFRGVASRLAGEAGKGRAIVHCSSTLAEKLRIDSMMRSERLLVDAQGVAHLGTWEWEPVGDHVTWSEELFRIYGVTPETYKPSFKGYLEKVHPDDRARVRDAMLRSVKLHQPFSHDERVVRPDGSIRYLHTWGHTVDRPDGSLERLVGVCQDITDRAEAELALRASEERYRQIVETAEEGVWLLDDQEKTLFANRKLASMLGYEPAELTGRNIFDFLDEKDHAGVREAIQRRRKGEREQHDLRLRRKDGSRLWAAVSASPTYDAQGKYSGMLKMLSDVTERRRNEMLLATQRRIFERLVQGSSLREALDDLVKTIESFSERVLASVLLLSADGRFVRTGAAPSLPEEYNKAIDDQPIGPEAGSCGTAAFRHELVVVEDIETDPLWERYRETAKEFGLKACWSSPILAGEKVLGTFALYFREPRKPTESELRTVRAFSAAAALVIQHVRLRDSLAEGEQRFRLLAEASSDGVVIHENGTILVTNKLGAAMIGYEPEELVGRNILDFAAPESREFQQEQIRSGNEGSYQILGLRRDGSKFWVEVRGRQALLNGRPVRIASVRDINEQRRNEEVRERMLAQERRARENAERAIRVRDEFLAIASHELKTPLTPLKLELQLLRRMMRQRFADPGEKESALFRALDLGEEELGRLNKLISDLLDVTRISSGRLELKREPCDLAEILKRVVERFSAQAVRDSIELTLETPAAVWGIWDRTRMDQVATNLVSNAMKYGQGTPVRVRLWEDPGRARFSVRDGGIGIDPADQARLFERFVRVAPLENYSGMGLGLFIVRQIVTGHGGEISVESTPGMGACFTVTLPLGEEAGNSANSGGT